jgi:hypothetical protein
LPYAIPPRVSPICAHLFFEYLFTAIITFLEKIAFGDAFISKTIETCYMLSQQLYGEKMGRGVC